METSDPTTNDYQRYFEDITFRLMVDRLVDFFSTCLNDRKLDMIQANELLSSAIILALHKVPKK